MENILPDHIVELSTRYCKRMESSFSKARDIIFESKKIEEGELQFNQLGALTAEMLYDNFTGNNTTWTKVYVESVIGLYNREEYNELFDFFTNTPYVEVERSLSRIINQNIPTNPAHVE